MSGYLNSGVNKMNKVGAYINENKLLLADKLGHAKVSNIKESILNQAIDDINRLKYAVNILGDKPTVSDLPATGNVKGDAWRVTEDGSEWAWNGTEWYELGNDGLETKIKTWTTEQIGRATSVCEERLRFNPVPVYDVTLAEDVTISPEHPYDIDSTVLGGSYAELWITCTLPTVMLVNCGCHFANASGQDVTGLLRTTGSRSACFSASHCAARYTIGWSGNTGIGAKSVFIIHTAPHFFDGDYTQISIVPTDADTLPAGTQIVVYGASPDQRITDVWGTELEEVTSEQIHSLFV